MVMSSSITVAKKPRRRNKVRSRGHALAPHRRPRIPGYTRKIVATGALFRKNSGLPRHTLSIRHRMRGDAESRHPSSRTGNHRRTTRPGRGTQRSTLYRRTPAIPGAGRNWTTSFVWTASQSTNATTRKSITSNWPASLQKNPGINRPANFRQHDCRSLLTHY
jgi:hypothetical protein